MRDQKKKYLNRLNASEMYRTSKPVQIPDSRMSQSPSKAY